MGIIDIVLYQTPNPDLSNGPDSTKIPRIAVSIPTSWMQEDGHVSTRGLKLVLCSGCEMMGPFKGWLRRSFGFCAGVFLGCAMFYDGEENIVADHAD